MRVLALLPVLMACLTAGCVNSETRWKTWHGGGVQRGPGGACETVEGVEVWTYGRPTRAYEVTGIIEDSRPGAVIPMRRRLGTVTRLARERGADGVIVLAERREHRGTLSTANAFTQMNAATQFNANTQFHPWDAATTTGNIYSTGSASTNAMGLSVALSQAFGTYQAFRYVK